MKVDEQLKCKDCDWYGSCEYYDRRKETSQICKMFNNTWKFVAELEKIKTEISDYAVVDDSKSIKKGFEIMQGIALGLLDNRISEMKGENNA